MFPKVTGVHGTNYWIARRSRFTDLARTDRRTQSIQPRSLTPRKPYSGANKYVMHFDRDQMPPAKGFWSLTMYDANYFFVANPLNRYTLSARNKLKTNAVGSVDLPIQQEFPGKSEESNWLPAPADKFVLMLRLYWPGETSPSLLDGSWTIPR